MTGVDIICFMRKNRAIPFRCSLLSLEGNFRISCKRNSTMEGIDEMIISFGSINKRGRGE